MIGIDASSYDTCEFTRWDIARSRGIRWASVRAATTDWLSRPIKDKMYDVNVSACRYNGIKIASYPWLDPLGDPVAQAENYLEIRNPATNWDMIDLENSGRFVANSRTHEKIATWFEIVLAEIRRLILVYTSQSYTFSYLQKAHWISQHSLFIANWEQPAPRFYLPFSPEYAAWQYTGKASGEYYGFNVPGFKIHSVALATMRQEFFDAA